MQTQQFISITEAAPLIGYSRQGFHQMLRRGEGPRVVRTGPKKTLLVRAEFLAWAEALGVPLKQAA